jgi:hypothetical protein
VLLANRITINAEVQPNDMDIDYEVSPGDLVSLKEAIDKLENIGDYTDVLTAKTGQFIIARLESKTPGGFNTWDDFLAAAKENFSKN